jgi:hypothetical protein
MQDDIMEFDKINQIMGTEGQDKSKKKYLQSLDDDAKPFKKGATGDGEPQ